MEESTGSTSPDNTGPSNSGLDGNSEGSDKDPDKIGFDISKTKQYSDLKSKSYRIISSIKENEQALHDIERLKKLNKKLPEKAQDSNTHLIDLKRNFPSFLDEESENTTI
jgi:predicted  nucleic acid-binding Zn-ribbon protein